MKRGTAGPGELGFTLVEVLVAVALVALAAGLGYETLAARPAQTRTTAVAFARLVAEARALAAVTTESTLDGGTGATLAVVRNGDAYVATLYAYRPILGAQRQPVPAPNSPPLRTSTAIELVAANAVIPPPFALFFSASGHVSAQAPFTVGVDAPFAREPICPDATGIGVAFEDGVDDRAYTVSCEMARLDLNTSVALGR